MRGEREMRTGAAAILLSLAVAGCTTRANVLGRTPDAAASDAPRADAGDPPEIVFERHVLSTDFVSEGVAAGDVDADGSVDIVTYPYWWSGPDFTARHELGTPVSPPLDPTASFSSVYGVYLWDVDEDECLDAVVVARETDPQMYWYESPWRPADSRCADPEAHWTPHGIVGPGLDSTIENPMLVELTAGSPSLVMGEGLSGTLAWWAPGADPTEPWPLHPISAGRFLGAERWSHGIGAGDLDRDGDVDVLSPAGWFERTGEDAWEPRSFGAFVGETPVSVCSQMRVYDVDADGLPDVLCSRPHDYGLFWWRQLPGAEPTFAEETIAAREISQMHALRLDDLDGDGVPEIITGKRWYANLEPGDPGQSDPAVLAYYAIVREPGGVRFVRHVIDDASGVGAQFEVADLNDDGRPDIVVSNKRGVFYFLQP